MNYILTLNENQRKLLMDVIDVYLRNGGLQVLSNTVDLYNVLQSARVEDQNVQIQNKEA